jgi:hypothetical protein
LVTADGLLTRREELPRKMQIQRKDARGGEMFVKRLPPIHGHFGTKPEPLAAQAICQGIVEGMLSDHFCGRSEAAYEARPRNCGWKLKPQR